MATTDDKRVFVDTNILLAATDIDRDLHGDAMDFLEKAEQGAYRLFASPQIYREYLVVATRPVEQNGLGLSPGDACRNVERFQQIIQTLPEGPETTERLVALTRRRHLKGKRIHDANLVVVMNANGLNRIKTYNADDFRGLGNLKRVPPRKDP